MTSPKADKRIKGAAARRAAAAAAHNKLRAARQDSGDVDVESGADDLF
jgi:hypothetical protein